MKLEMSTTWMPIINPGLYWGELGNYYNDIHPDYCSDFKKAICEYGTESINEALSWISADFGEMKVLNTEFKSEFYNFSYDWLEFTLDVPNNLPEIIFRDYKRKSAEFLEYASKRYGSRSGFVSFMPYEKENFESAILLKNYDLSMAIAMYLMFAIENSGENLYELQDRFEDSVAEEGNRNGWYDYYGEELE